MKRDLICFDPNCVFFAGCISISFYRLYSGVLSSSIWILYQGRIFLAATERKNITDLLCFEHAQDKIFDAIFCKVKKSSFFLSLAFGAENKKIYRSRFALVKKFDLDL